MFGVPCTFFPEPLISDLSLSTAHSVWGYHLSTCCASICLWLSGLVQTLPFKAIGWGFAFQSLFVSVHSTSSSKWWPWNPPLQSQQTLGTCLEGNWIKLDRTDICKLKPLLFSDAFFKAHETNGEVNYTSCLEFLEYHKRKSMCLVCFWFHC